jgi:hypothetical protein
MLMARQKSLKVMAEVAADAAKTGAVILTRMNEHGLCVVCRWLAA